MNDIMKIIRINGYIQREGKLFLFGNEVECVALDRTCTFSSVSESDIELSDSQIEDLLNQTFGQAPATSAPKPTYKILGVRWWTPRQDTIGIVAIETSIGEWKAYLGTAAGHDQEFDEQFVASWGAGLSPEEAHGFFPHLDIEQYKKD